MFNIRFPSPNRFNNTNNPLPRTPRPNNNGLTNNFRSPRPYNPRYGVQRPRYNTPYKNYNQNNDQLQEHWCETCDRGFKSNELLEEHKSEHQKCGIDGCKFIAHPKIVTKHIQMQHSTGLFNRIRNLETPEDIEKWIQERKKNYPSKETIDKKKAQLEECIDRGEKIRDKKSRFNNRNNNFKESKFGNNRNKFNQKKNNRHFNKLNSETSKLSKPEPISIDLKKCNEDEEKYCNIEPFKGISEIIRNDIINNDDLEKNDNLNIEDDDWVEISDSKANLPKALSCLIDAYGSSDEDEIIEEKCDNIKTENLIQIISSKDNENDNDSAPEETVINRSDDIAKMIESSVNTVINVDQKKVQKKNKPFESQESKDNPSGSKRFKKDNKHPNTAFEQQIKYYKERPSTLLEKLLEKDIKHERNVILQCVQYIVKNNFFDK